MFFDPRVVSLIVSLDYLYRKGLYTKLCDYLTKHLEQLVGESEAHTGYALLAFYTRECTRYSLAAKYINSILGYFNNHWVTFELMQGKRNIYDVYTLHLVQWRDVLSTRISGKVVDSVLRLVEKQRGSQNVDSAHIKLMVNSLIIIGVSDEDPSKSTLDVYRAI